MTIEGRSKAARAAFEQSLPQIGPDRLTKALFSETCESQSTVAF
jgi:hypothetical protein